MINRKDEFVINRSVDNENTSWHKKVPKHLQEDLFAHGHVRHPFGIAGTPLASDPEDGRCRDGSHPRRAHIRSRSGPGRPGRLRDGAKDRRVNNHPQSIHSEWKPGDGQPNRLSIAATTLALDQEAFSWRLSYVHGFLGSTVLNVAVGDACDPDRQ
jgi:hypothetical protein